MGCRRRTKVVEFRWRTSVVGITTAVGCKWREVVGFARRATVVSFRWRTLVVGNEVQWRTTVVGFKWRTVVGFARRRTVVSFRWRTIAMCYRQGTTMVGFKWTTLVVGGWLKQKNYSRWLQMENSSGLRTENDSGVLQIQWWGSDGER